MIVLITLLPLVFGIWYAVYIYRYPFNLTWLSVVIGDGATDVFMSIAIFFTLEYYGQSQLWFMAFIPFVMHSLTGVPMIAGQVYKQYRLTHKYTRIVKNGL